MKYKNLRMVARVFEVLAWVMGLGVFALGISSGLVEGGNILFGIIIGVVGGFLGFVFTYAFAQLIYVLLDIERNTRATVKALYEEAVQEEETEGKGNTDTEEGK
jgi:hypothetical protein